MYDIFYVSRGSGNDDDWKKIKSKYPLAQRLSNVNSYEDIKTKAFTKMFWAIWENVDLIDSFNLLDYTATKWDDMYVHVFKNGDFYDGICLFPKQKTISQREFENRFFTDKKEIDIIASVPKKYEQFYINSYEEYLDAKNKTVTDMFWVVWNDLKIEEGFDFNFTVPKYNTNVVHIFKNGDFYDGICLFPKNTTITKKEFQHRFFAEKKEIDIIASRPNRYHIYKPSSYNEYMKIEDEMFWIVWPNVDVINDSIFDLYFSHHNSYDRQENHIFKNLCNDKESYLSGVILCSKHKRLSKKEFDRQYAVDKKEYDIIASRYRYPIYELDSYDRYLEICQTGQSKMFWGKWPEIAMIDKTIFDLYFDPNDGKYDHDRAENHVFLNRCYDRESYLSGLVLFSKDKIISKKEFERRYLIDKKEHDVVVSKFCYPIFKIESYDQYLEITKNSKQPMFWCQWSNIEIIDETIFDLYFDPNDGKYDYDRSENHVFKNRCDKKESFLNGLVLFSKDKIISKKEFERKYLIDKKEHEIVASKFCYPIFKIDDYDDYLKIIESQTQPMFWCQWPNIEIIDESIFDLYFDPNDGMYDHDRNENHVFKNLCNNSPSFLNGLLLCSKNKIISKREFDRKYLIDKKEHDRTVSRFRYNRYNVTSYQHYQEILEKEKQKLFWVIWPEITVIDETVFDLYFDPNDGKYDHDRNENHTFKHLFNDKEIYINSLVLLSKDKPLSQREFDHRFLITKKEHDRLVSMHRPYDVVFISYNEPNADENYNNLIKICPRAKRVHGVKGIHQAHIKAASLCDTDMFWVIDGDAMIEKDFNFNLVMSSYDVDCVHVWRSRNPINDLEYGYGGVKLLPRQMVLDMDVTTPDMTTSISKKFKAMDRVSNINAFNTDEFATWRSAFRECCKLASRIIEGQYEEETIERLDIWCSQGADRKFGQWAISGAKLGREYGLENKNNPEALRKINDFDWLKRVFDGIQ